MSSERQLRVGAAHCLSLLQSYHDVDRTAATKERMVAEVEMIVGWLMELDLTSGETEVGILKPVERQLLEQYGFVEGRRLNGEFIEAFEGAGIPRDIEYQFNYIKYNLKIYKFNVK